MIACVASRRRPLQENAGMIETCTRVWNSSYKEMNQENARKKILSWMCPQRHDASRLITRNTPKIMTEIPRLTAASLTLGLVHL